MGLASTLRSPRRAAAALLIVGGGLGLAAPAGAEVPPDYITVVFGEQCEMAIAKAASVTTKLSRTIHIPAEAGGKATTSRTVADELQRRWRKEVTPAPEGARARAGLFVLVVHDESGGALHLDYIHRGSYTSSDGRRHWTQKTLRAIEFSTIDFAWKKETTAFFRAARKHCLSSRAKGWKAKARPVGAWDR